MNRRQFISSSTAGAAGVVLSRNVAWAAGARATRGPTGHAVRGAASRRRHVHRHRRHHRLPRERRRRDCGRQPVHEHRHDLRGRPEGARAQGRCHAPQHASSRRPHRRQQGLRREQDRRARELPEVAQATTEKTVGRAGLRLDDVQGHLDGEVRQRNHRDALLRAGPHRRRCGGPLPAGQRHAHGRPAVQPRAPQHRSRPGRPHRQLDHRARNGVEARVERHHLHRRPRQGQRRQEHARRGVALPQLPDRGARPRPRRCQGGPVEGRDPEAAGAQGIRRQRLAERAIDDGLRARDCLRRNYEGNRHST